jgi:hypothetical protein
VLTGEGRAVELAGEGRAVVPEDISALGAVLAGVLGLLRPLAGAARLVGWVRLGTVVDTAIGVRPVAPAELAPVMPATRGDVAEMCGDVAAGAVGLDAAAVRGSAALGEGAVLTSGERGDALVGELEDGARPERVVSLGGEEAAGARVGGATAREAVPSLAGA